MEFDNEFYLVEIKTFFNKMYNKINTVKLEKTELKDYYDIMDEIILYLQNNKDNNDYVFNVYTRIKNIYLKYNEEEFVKTR